MDSNFRLQVILNHMRKHVYKPASTKQYKYTVDNNILSEEQRQFYEENGYLVIPNLIKHEDIDEYISRFVDICNGKVPMGNMSALRDKSLLKAGAKGIYLYNKVQDIAWDNVLYKYVIDPLLLDYVQCFTGPNINAFHSMIINKPPDSAITTSEHLMHQDLHYFPMRPADRIVASWTAMEKVYVENGCLYVIPGTHKANLQRHEYPKEDVLSAFHGLRGFDRIPRVSLPMEKGDTVFFHPLLFHGSWPNLTKGFRRCISAHFSTAECTYIEDVSGTSHENVNEEIKKLTKRKFGVEMNMAEVVRLKQRLVRGTDQFSNKKHSI